MRASHATGIHLNRTPYSDDPGPLSFVARPSPPPGSLAVELTPTVHLYGTPGEISEFAHAILAAVGLSESGETLTAAVEPVGAS